MARVDVEKAKGTADMQAQLAAVGGRHRASRTTRRRPATRRRVVKRRSWSSPVRPRRPRPRPSVSRRRRPPKRSGSRAAAGLRGADRSARPDRDRAGRGGERGGRRPHHRRARSARDRRRRRCARRPRRDAHAHARYRQRQRRQRPQAAARRAGGRRAGRRSARPSRCSPTEVRRRVASPETPARLAHLSTSFQGTPLSTRGSPGRPSTRSPMMFFITSSEPPAMCAAGAPSSVWCTAVVVVAARDGADADDVDRELAHLGEHLAAEELADRAFRARAPGP